MISCRWNYWIRYLRLYYTISKDRGDPPPKKKNKKKKQNKLASVQLTPLLESDFLNTKVNMRVTILEDNFRALTGGIKRHPPKRRCPNCNEIPHYFQIMVKVQDLYSTFSWSLPEIILSLMRTSNSLTEKYFHVIQWTFISASATFN